MYEVKRMHREIEKTLKKINEEKEEKINKLLNEDKINTYFVIIAPIVLISFPLVAMAIAAALLPPEVGELPEVGIAAFGGGFIGSILLVLFLRKFLFKYYERKAERVREYYDELYEKVKKEYEKIISEELSKVKSAEYFYCMADLTEYCLLDVLKFADDLADALKEFVEEGKVLKIKEILGRVGWATGRCPWECQHSVDEPEYRHAKVFEWVKEVWDAIYYDDIDKLKKLVESIRTKIRDDYFRRHLTTYSSLPVKTDFYLRLLEFHYILANSIVREYEAQIVVTQPLGASESAVSSTERSWDNVLFEGTCLFRFGAISQWRDGVIRVTGAGVELEGKLRVRSLNLTVLAVKAAARAAGVGEVNERIPYSSISSYDYDSKKVVIHAGGKKYVIKTPAASRIGSLLDRFVKGR